MYYFYPAFTNGLLPIFRFRFLSGSFFFLQGIKEEKYTHICSALTLAHHQSSDAIGLNIRFLFFHKKKQQQQRKPTHQHKHAHVCISSQFPLEPSSEKREVSHPKKKLLILKGIPMCRCLVGVQKGTILERKEKERERKTLHD